MRTGSRRTGALVRRIVGLAALLPALAGCAREPVDRIVLIVVDTLRADRLGVYGAQPTRTPEIDRRATGAAIFDHAFSTSPWTLPSLGSVLTGRWPTGHGAGMRPYGRRPMDEEVPTLAETLSVAGFATAGVVNNPFLRPYFGLSRGFADWDPGSDRRAGAVTDAAIAWLEGHRNERSFLFVHYIDPHVPYDPPEPFRGRFEEAEEVEGLAPPILSDPIRKSLATLTDAQERFIAGLYDEEVLYVDSEVGRLLDALSVIDPSPRTLVVLTSDHGEELFEHGGYEHGHALWQELLHVPVVAWGGAVEARRLDAPFTLADLAATLAGAAGLEPHELGGRSWWPALTGGRPPRPRRPLIAEGILYGAERKAIVRWPAKLVVDPKRGTRELFDLARDPAESHDLAERKPRVARRLAALLEVELGREAGGASSEPAELDAETIEELRALGYLN